MNLNKSLGKLSWRMGNGTFTPNTDDINSLNEVLDYVEKKEKQQLIDNQLFGKMYIYLFGEFCRYYKTDPTDKIPQKELHRLLDKKIQDVVVDFVDKINNAKMSKITNEKQLEDFEPFDHEEVSDNLRIMVNAAINTYS